MTPSLIVDDNPTSYDLGDLGVLNNLPAYNVNEGVDRSLDVMREVYVDGNYYPLIVPFPASANINIGALQQLSGSIAVPQGAILIALTGFSDQGNFRVRIYDSATNQDLFYGSLGLGANSTPSMDAGLGDTPNVLGPNLIQAPYLVIVPNALQVTVVNLMTVAANIQVALHFAVPITSVMDTINAPVEGMS